MTKDRGDYEVGYRRPPQEHQFQPGQSGNRKGRPKGARSLTTELKELLEMPIHLSEGGKRRKVSTLKAVLLRLREQALKGDQRAIDRFLSLAAGTAANSDVQSTMEELTAEDRLILSSYASALPASKGDRDAGE